MLTFGFSISSRSSFNMLSINVLLARIYCTRGDQRSVLQSLILPFALSITLIFASCHTCRPDDQIYYSQSVTAAYTRAGKITVECTGRVILMDFRLDLYGGGLASYLADSMNNWLGTRSDALNRLKQRLRARTFSTHFGPCSSFDPTVFIYSSN